MSAMYDMLFSGRFVHDEQIVRRIRSEIATHPFEYVVDATPQVVFDDESWAIFKSNLAKQAKQRKKEKIPIKKTPVRTNRDVTFDRIPFDGSKKIIRICKSSFEITKYANFEEIKKIYNKTDADNIYNILTGECDSSSYFWTQS